MSTDSPLEVCYKMGNSAASGPQNSADGPEFKTSPTPPPKKIHKPKSTTHGIKIIGNHMIHSVAQGKLKLWDAGALKVSLKSILLL